MLALMFSSLGQLDTDIVLIPTKNHMQNLTIKNLPDSFQDRLKLIVIVSD